MNNKTMRLVATNTIATLQTTTVGTGEGGPFMEYSHMDVIAIVNTITAGSTVDVTVKEWFATSPGSTTGFFLTTAKATGITSTMGSVFMTYDDNSQVGPYAPPGTEQNAMLGKGTLKQVITSASSANATLSADVVFVYWSI